MSEPYIPVENLRIKIPNYIEESSEESSKKSLDNKIIEDNRDEEEHDNNLLSLYKFITCSCKIRIPRFFTVYKIF